MKINVEKISKLQAGGYLTYRPLTKPAENIPEQEDEPTAKEVKAANAGVGIDEKSMQKLLGNGITNDVIAFSDSMQTVETQYASLTDSEREGPKGRHLRSMLKGNFAELNALIRSKDLFDKAYQKSQASGGLEEFAVVPGGFVVKKADGTLDKVGFAQFTKDKASGELAYKPLTNAELAKEREYNKALVGNSSVFSVLEYSKGIGEVQKEVLLIANGLGKTHQSTSTGAYDEGTVEAMREAKLAAGQGLFKVKETQTVTTNKPQIERAKQVMWATLNDNSKNVLRARAAFLENDPGKIEERAALLAMDLLDSRLDQSQVNVSDMMVTKGSKGSSGGGSGPGDALGEMGSREAAAQGKTQTETLALLSDYGVDISSRMYTLPKEDITKTKDGANLPVSIANSKLGEYAFTTRATTMDGAKVDVNNTIFTDEIFWTRLPVIKLANGGLMLDEAGAKKLALAEEEISNLPEHLNTATNKERIRMKHGAKNLNIEKVIIAEAASYDDKYRLMGLRGKRDPKYFKDADDSTTQLLGQTVDPEETGVRNYLDYKAYKHLVIIPTKGEEFNRFSDKNSLYAPKKGWDTTNPARGPSTSGSTFSGSAFQPANPNFAQSTLE